MNLGRISLEDFAVDPQLGGFPEASPAQRLVLRLLDGLPPADADQREVFETIAGRPWGDDLLTPRKIVALIMGADSGKSLVAAPALLHRALFADLTGLRPGQRGVGLLVAPDTRLASIPLNYCRGIVSTSALIRAEVEGEPTSDSIRFVRGTEITVLPATLGGRAVRGRRYILAVPEECAFFRDSDFAVNDVEIIRAIRPRLLPGAQLVPISTPYRRSGYLYDLHRAEFGRSEKALVLQASTAVMRPDRSREDLDAEYAADPTSAAAELGALFLENTAALFESADLEEVIEPGTAGREREEGFAFVAGMDPSGLRSDPWAFTILGQKSGGPIVQFVVRSWRPGSTVDQIVSDIGAELKRFGIGSVATDQYGSEVTKAHFSRASIQVREFPFTSGPNSPKTLGFRSLRELVVGRRIRLLDDPVQSRELRLLEVSRLSGGGERIAAPGRLHDDRACALALAVHVLVGAGIEPAVIGWARGEVERRRAERAAAPLRQVALSQETLAAVTPPGSEVETPTEPAMPQGWRTPETEAEEVAAFWRGVR